MILDEEGLGLIDQRARELRLFADGIADAGHPELARRAGLAATDLARLVEEVRAERAARTSIQAQHAEAMRLLGNRAAAAARGSAL